MDEVLRMVEEKGKENNILKYNKLARLRSKRYTKHVLENQSKYIDKTKKNENGDAEKIIDSAHIIIGWKIAKNHKEAKRLERMAEYREKQMKKAKRNEFNEEGEILDLLSSQSSTVSSNYPDQRERSSEKFINDFVEKCFYSLNLDSDA